MGIDLTTHNPAYTRFLTVLRSNALAEFPYICRRFTNLSGR